ncbi:MAG: PIN domain-containing protein [Treponema sp.]|nr:PIN domain-containing protein [Treponema sp.]
MTYIFDACALFALFKREEGAEEIRALLDEAMTEQAVIYMNIINLIEVYYGFYRTLGKEKSGIILEQVYAMPIHFIDTIDSVIFSETSRLKAQYAIPLGDSIGLATAVKMGGTFVTADHSDFSKIEKSEPIPFFWFR